MRSIARYVFGRPVLMVLCLVVQFLTICIAVRLCSGVAGAWFRVATTVAAWATVVVILSGSSDAGYKTAWSILVLALPVFGLLCYALLGGSRKNRRLRRIHGRAQDYLHTHLSQDGQALAQLWEEAPEAGIQATAIARLGNCPLWYGGQTQWFSEGEDCFRAMLKDLRQAEKSIWLEYFIIRPGVMWDSILTILRQKAAKGVDVRLIYDDFGCLPGLPGNYSKTLQQMRIRCCVFNPFQPPLSGRLGNRDHRKLMLIDGKLCYTGGINLSDEYIGLRQRFGHWKDGAIRIEGEGVYSFSALFLSMWTALSGDAQPAPPKPREKEAHYCYMQPFWDSPLHPEPVGRSAIAGLIGRAQESIWLMTPYLVPDEALCKSLCLAAASGLDVKLITPGVGDKWYTQALTRAHYARLLDAGVKIYEYAPGFLHSKVCCADSQVAVVGTVNLDYRSFYLQFEDGIWLYGQSAVEQIAEDFTRTLEKCRSITPKLCAGISWPRRAGCSPTSSRARPGAIPTPAMCCWAIWPPTSTASPIATP